MTFQLVKTAQGSRARLGSLSTRRGDIQTPVFMPVGTQATVKAMTPEELKAIGTEILLANTYHLFLKPGEKIIRKLGGLHRFMHWEGPILTDSGGYQIFSLSQTCKIKEEGAFFQSPIDGGAPHLLTPEMTIEIQEALGADIMMVLDECLPFPATEEQAKKSMALSLQWAKRSLHARKRDAALFGIVQGGMYPNLRREYIEKLTAISNLSWDGYAIGGLSVGEPIPQMYEMTAVCTESLPKEKPRYLMGVGSPQDLVECIDLGIDMFDCILPTRAARHGTIYTAKGKLLIRNETYKEDPKPLDEDCRCYTCRYYSRAYLRHLSMAKEILSARLCTLHNLHYYLDLIRGIRCAIRKDRYVEFKRTFYREQEKPL